MEISNKKLIRYFLNTNYLCSLLSRSQKYTVPLFSKTLNPCLPQTPPSTLSQFHANPTSRSLSCSISSSGFPSFCSKIYPISQSLTYRTSYRYSHSLLLRPRGQYRLLSVPSSDKESKFKKMRIVGSDESEFRLRTVGGFGSNVSSKNISEIIEVIRSDEDDLEVKLNTKSVSLSVESLSGIFRVLNCERVCALRFFVWARDTYPSLYYNDKVCSLIIDNCGWLDDYETMLCLLKDFRKKGICLTEKAFGFLPVLGSSMASIMECIRRVIEVLNEVGGSCRGSGIHALIKMLSEVGLFEMAKFVIEITDRKASYYNNLILVKCRRCSFGEARGVLEEMRLLNCVPDATTFNYLLSALCKHDRTAEACNLLEEMKEKGCPPDALTFEIFIHFSCRLCKLDAAVQFFDQMVARGLEPRLTTHAAFVRGYFNSGQYEEAYNYVVGSSVKYEYAGNKVYSLLANLHRRKGNLTIAGDLLIEMMDKGLIPEFKVYLKISQRLYKSGGAQLAGYLKGRFYELRSECSK